ncbi:hypothetical protein, partial [Pararcticibacter amylolyticus]|uniref:hypothetical protein n=1 Tax=Pararcticibacter amylolyticus TaxID=2173175 RepID=UPI001304A1A4
KKVLFSAAILAFAGVTAFSTTNHHTTISKDSVTWQDTTKKDTTETPADTTSTPTDTTKVN